MRINTVVNKYKGKLKDKYQFMSHFINQLMPTFIFNIIFGAFNGMKFNH